MSLQWTLVACFLYIEIAFSILIILPIISVTKWHQLFKSKFIKNLSAQSQIIFYTFLVILLLLFVDSIREMQKYSHGKELDSEHGHLDAELQHSMKLFRAQRNFYIAGFALFLYILIRRLIILLNDYAIAIANQKASLKQAQNAATILEQYLHSNEETSSNKSDNEKVKIDGDKGKVDGDKLISTEQKQNEINLEKESKKFDELDKLRLELAEYKEENIKLKKKHAAIKKQAESVTHEYDRLCKNYEELNKDFLKLANKEPNKKDD